MKKWKSVFTAVLFLTGISVFPVFGVQTQEILKNVELFQTYDEKTDRFVQTIEENVSFSSTIPQNLLTSGGVQFDQFSDGITYVLEKNGKSVDYKSGQLITESGQYHLQLLVLPQINLKGMEDPSLEQLENDAFELENLQIFDRDYTVSADFYFTIVGSSISELHYIRAPEGYRISKLLFNGKETNLPDKDWCRLEDDGAYEIYFKALMKQMPEFQTAFKKDTRPPLLEFEGVAADGTAKKTAVYKSTEENCTVSVYREGRLIDENSGELQTPGLYRLVVSDQAGNHTSYMIRVKEHYPFLLFFLIFGGIILSFLGMYFVFRNQKLTVR